MTTKDFMHLTTASALADALHIPRGSVKDIAQDLGIEPLRARHPLNTGGRPALWFNPNQVQRIRAALRRGDEHGNLYTTAQAARSLKLSKNGFVKIARERLYMSHVSQTTRAGMPVYLWSAHQAKEVRKALLTGEPKCT